MCVPIVVHCLDFDARACWGYHGAVLCGKKYVEFAAQNSVDVVGMIGIEEAVRKKDKRAQTYEGQADGATVQFLLEFPGLTADDLAKMTEKAAPYDTTGYAPFTAVVDPWTEKAVRSWSGGQGAHSILEGVADARKSLEKEHGKGATRADVRSFRAAEAAAAGEAAKGEFSSALDSLARASAAAEKGPEALKGLYREARAAVVAAAEKALTAVEQKKVRDSAGAKRDLIDLIQHLKGTGLEERAKALLAALE